MKIVNKHNGKKGFTLLEVMLAIAIMLITFESIFSLMVSVYNSHLEVSYMNGATELLELNSLALERSVLGFAGSSASSVTYSADGAVISNGSGKLFNLNSVKGRGNIDKFTISLEFSKLSEEEVQYKIIVRDMENGGTQYGSVTNTIWLPHASGKISIAASGSSLTLTK